ncbi:MAG: hypothetical protein IPF42_19590 [Candidatus Microthrix sp.]|nr:hypothetical protein [Candidatus Microthrix sp.]
MSERRDLRASEDVTDREHGDQLVAFASSWITLGYRCNCTLLHQRAGGRTLSYHWRRHHWSKNHLDGYNYECTGKGLLPADKAVGWIDGYEGLNHSALYFALQIPDDIDALAGTEKQGDWRPQPLPEADSRANRKERAKLLDTDGALPGWLGELLAQVLVEVYAEPAEGGLDVPPYPGERGPHPRNLVGSNFLQDIGDGTAFFDKWLNLLGIDGLGMASNELLAAITPGFVADVPEGFPMPWEIGVAYRFMLSWFKREFTPRWIWTNPRDQPGTHHPRATSTSAHPTFPASTRRMIHYRNSVNRSSLF